MKCFLNVKIVVLIVDFPLGIAVVFQRKFVVVGHNKCPVPKRLRETCHGDIRYVLTKNWMHRITNIILRENAKCEKILVSDWFWRSNKTKLTLKNHPKLVCKIVENVIIKLSKNGFEKEQKNLKMTANNAPFCRISLCKGHNAIENGGNCRNLN